MALERVNKERGVSLVELVVVVGIILILAAIAIPRLNTARFSANEASAVNSLRLLNNAEVTFASTYQSGFTDGLSRLRRPASGSPDANNADLLDAVLAGCMVGGDGRKFIRNGYVFVYKPTGTNLTFGSIGAYEITADPQARGATGQRSFFTNELLIIRVNATTAATASDSPI